LAAVGHPFPPPQRAPLPQLFDPEEKYDLPKTKTQLQVACEKEDAFIKQQQAILIARDIVGKQQGSSNTKRKSSKV
jgi:hypothetical protein